MSNPARILEKLRQRPVDMSFRDLDLLLRDLGWTQRDGKGSHSIFKSPGGFNISVPKANKRVKRFYLDSILKEIERGEGT